MNRRVAVVTICAKNYFAKAKVLQQSYLDHHPEHFFYILLVDRKDENFAALHTDCNLIWVEDLGIPGVLKYAFMYDIIEFSTNVKPVALRSLLGKYDEVLYIDPDIQIFDHLTPVFDALAKHSIVITPHALSPVLDGKSPNDIDFLRFGAYNLGFIGVSNCKEAFEFLDWWSSRCLSHGFYEPQTGLAVDQKWIDLVPAYFPGVKIMREPGLNLSFWNLHERFLSKVDGHWLVNDIHKLYFIHFSSFDESEPGAIAMKQNRFSPEEREDVLPLYAAYAQLLNRHKAKEYKSMSYSFDFFDDGVYITAAMRRFYACLQVKFDAVSNPFASNSTVRKWGESKGLVSRKILPMQRQNFKSLENYGTQLKVIYFFLRIILRIVGPIRYFSLMRLLPSLSSIRGQARVVV
ncbi:hypothetical protein [Propionivibrio sp.]|uniref:hypothetical protein n=1 Tax=Propionivibrio sp. TaxID=2212460 RepID=UPI0026237CA4|nr:hypothetical protein [Propionivibrio sp.]